MAMTPGLSSLQWKARTSSTPVMSLSMMRSPVSVQRRKPQGALAQGALQGAPRSRTCRGAPPCRPFVPRSFGRSKGPSSSSSPGSSEKSEDSEKSSATPQSDWKRKDDAAAAEEEESSDTPATSQAAVQSKNGAPAPAPLTTPGDSANETQTNTNKKHTWLPQSLMRPLADFGFGRRSIEEGLLGVFAVAGVGMTALVMTWVSAATTAARRHTYQMKMSFPRAMGITVGTPVRIRGVQVGSVLSVRPSLASVDVLCEIDDEAIKVPRNALVEANQSGLIAETLIDITPRMPLPPDDTLGPKDTRCHDQGHLVCHMGEIEGEVGTSLDDLVGVCTRLARRMEAGTMDTMEDTAKAAQDAATHAIPLLEKMKLIATNVAPMVEDLKDGEAGPTASRLLTELHDLAESMIRITEVMADEPQLETMKTMVTRSERCLAEVERISKDLSKVTGDDALMTNLKSIVQSVSRILES